MAYFESPPPKPEYTVTEMLEALDKGGKSEKSEAYHEKLRAYERRKTLAHIGTTCAVIVFFIGLATVFGWFK